MPELPEVETIRQDLNKKVTGATITEVIYTNDGENLISKSGQDLRDLIAGEKITNINRRAKYLLIALSSGSNLIVHLKLTGRLLVRGPSYPEDLFTRLILKLDDSREVRFADRNGFGEVRLIGTSEDVDSNLAPDPFEISTQQFQNFLGKSNKNTIKETLLDQKVVSGMGNIYADEALYLAQINPFRSPKSLSPTETNILIASIKKVLEDGIKDRGTTIDSYVDADGRPGTHQFHLLVYGKSGKPCRRCATKIALTEIADRRTYFCPTCQPDQQLRLL